MDNMGSSLESDLSRKPVRRRRSHARKTNTQDRGVNMAEARREIAHALHLHRSSSSSSGASKRGPINLLGDNYTPEPVWSTATTTTAVKGPPPMETEEFEWGENQAASYSWWLGFLKTLDGNSATPFVKDETEMISDPGVFGQCEIHVSGLEESSHGQLTSTTDEWLTFPDNEDQDEKQVH
ncbi:hypothetical protein OIU77_017278 [Salix suchowensis]|uniref:FORMIN-F-LIKE n=2 Tax=Salix TaxID=40685 RepID=A0A9Q1ANK4_9ROSI|nr:hypothetical protein OIU77_017278 [Salix suchowensis]KAJ6778020.1 FORMIN-F-LIKE [Salix koriyanagi]